MAKTGIFSRVNNLVGTTLTETERVANSGLSTVGNTFDILEHTTQEFLNDSKEDLLDSTINLARKKAGYRNELQELGFNDDTIEQLLA